MPHILLLEPDLLLAATTKQFLKRAGFSVAAHSDPQKAVFQADKQLPDLVITELQLAGRSGVEFLYEFRSYPDWQAVPVIVYSNLNTQDVADYRAVFQEFSIEHYLYKPTTSLENLLLLVQHSLQATGV